MKKQKAVIETTRKNVLALSDIWKPPDANEFNRWLRATIFGDDELNVPVPKEYIDLLLSTKAKINKAKSLPLESPVDIELAEKFKKEIEAFIENEIENKFTPGKNFLYTVWKESIAIIGDLKNDLQIACDDLKKRVSDWKTAEEKKKIKSNERELAKVDEITQKFEVRADAWEAKGKPEKAEEIRNQATQFIPNLEVVKATGWKYTLTITDKKMFWREVVKSFDATPMIDIEKIVIPVSMLNELAGKLKKGIGVDTALPWGNIKAEQK